MDLHFNQNLASKYHSESQKTRVLTEDWLGRNMFCPVCGAPVLGQYEANRPVADFFCDDCKSDFELKSKECKTGIVSGKIADGAYDTMIERITSLRNPHLFVMTYADWSVNNLLVIPKFFFVPEIIEKRNPLSATARRAGWTGCNIEIGNIPESVKIYIVRKGLEADKSLVLDQYQRIRQLQKTKLESRGWLMDVLMCIERIPGKDFRLDEVYSFADELQMKHPDNNFVHDKIRQQLQYLRDKGFVQFVDRGKYHKIG